MESATVKSDSNNSKQNLRIPLSHQSKSPVLTIKANWQLISNQFKTILVN